jgi:hypothetical protein
MRKNENKEPYDGENYWFNLLADFCVLAMMCCFVVVIIAGFCKGGVPSPVIWTLFAMTFAVVERINFVYRA